MSKMNTNKARWMGAGSLAAAAALALSVTALQPTRAQGTLPERPFLPLAFALDAANAAMSECSNGGYYVSVAVVDRHGNLKALIRSDDSGPHTIKASERKAFTAASMGRATGDIAESIAADETLAGLRDLDDRILILGGGLPIRFNNQVIGGIGVAGAPSGQIDDECAAAGLAAIGADEEGDIGTGTPEATEEATGTPEATEEATGTPEATEEATGTPEATGTATPFATSTPDATGTITVSVTISPLITGTPDAFATGTSTPIAIGTIDVTGTVTPTTP
jgi:uncharacterized protein GlcG (DUF336 family)